jgi:hypothetical protein
MSMDIDDGMVVIGGIRYRVEDATSLGLVPPPGRHVAPEEPEESAEEPEAPEEKQATPDNKGRAAANK